MKRVLTILLMAFAFATVLFGGLNKRDRSMQKSTDATSIQDIYMDANRMNGIVRNNGCWFMDIENSTWGLEWPKGSGLSPIYAGGQWITAKVDNTVRVAAVIHDASEFQPGEIISGAATNPNDDKYRWYVIEPDGIGDWSNWPVDQGAPVDSLGNPLLIGSKTAFSVWNDLGLHTNFGSASLGAEVRQVMFQFNRADALGDMTFIKWQIINKGNAPWDSTYLSIWQDPDIGDGNDDLVGCDPELGLGYCYNGSNNDQQYGAAPPAMGIDFFQGPIIDEIGSTVTLPGGIEIIDKKMLKMTAFAFYNNNDSPQGNPNTTSDVWNYLRGFWKDNSAIIDPITSTSNPFMFNGDPEGNTGWLDEDSADRRFLMTTGPFTMPRWVDTNANGKPDFGEPGVQEIVAGVLLGRGSSNLNSVSFLKAVDRIAQQTYDNNFAVPIPPKPPVVEVSQMPNAVALTWDQRSEYDADGVTPYEQTDVSANGLIGQSIVVDGAYSEVTDGTYDFMDYRVYQFVDAQGDEPVLVDSLGAYKPADFTSYGGSRYVLLTENKHTRVGEVGTPLVNGKAYYFGIQANAYCKFASPQVLSSPMIIVTVIPQNSPGSRFTSNSGDTLVVHHLTTSGMPSDGSAMAFVIDPSKVTGQYYKVMFNTNNTWNLLRSADSLFATADTVLKNQTNQTGNDAYNVVDGVLVKVLGPSRDFKNFQVISNASGPLNPPEMGCFAFNGNGFPFLRGYDGLPIEGDIDRPTNGVQQSTNNSAWGIHTFMNADDMGAGYTYFVTRVTQGGARWPILIPNEWEMRFTAAGGKAFAPLAYTTGDMAGGALIDVPFELWNVGDLANPNDDVRYFPYIFDVDNNGQFNLLTQAGVDAAGNLAGDGADHSLSGGDNDPFTDAFYWMIPENTSPGQTGYDALVAKIQAEGAAYAFTDGTQGDSFRRMVLVNWNGGSVATAAFNSTMPETGTTFRVVTTKPNLPIDYFIFKSKSVTTNLADKKFDLNKINVVPNPYYGYHSGEMNPYNRWVQFTYLPAKCTIRIFDLAGSMIRKIEKDDANTLLRWDLKTEFELPVASGIYVYHVEVPGLGNKIGKIAVFTPNERLDAY